MSILLQFAIASCIASRARGIPSVNSPRTTSTIAKPTACQQTGPALGRHAVVAKEISPELAVTDTDDEIFFGQPERTKHIDTERYQFDVRAKIFFTNDVAIELKMFAQPAALLLFVTEKLPN